MKTCKFEGCGRPIVGRAAQAKFCKKCAPLANRASTHQSWLDNRDARKKYQNDRLDRLDRLDCPDLPDRLSRLDRLVYHPDLPERPELLERLERLTLNHTAHCIQRLLTAPCTRRLY